MGLLGFSGAAGLIANGPAWDQPHRIAGVCYKDGSPVSRRVEIRRRVTGEYIASTVTDANGIFSFRNLPPQTLATPYVITAYDDSVADFTNALIFDRVYQVDDDGLPPQT
jgi:hypothetical protein